MNLLVSLSSRKLNLKFDKIREQTFGKHGGIEHFQQFKVMKCQSVLCWTYLFQVCRCMYLIFRYLKIRHLFMHT